MPVYAHMPCMLTCRVIYSIFIYRFEFRLISHICNDAPFHEVGGSGRDEMFKR